MMRATILGVLLSGLGSVTGVHVCSADDGATRIWHDRSGHFTLEAAIVSIERKEKGPDLKLRKTDGAVVEIPYALFADVDQKHAVAWYRERQNKPTARPKPKLPIVGDRVQMKYSGRWWKGEVVKIEDERFRFSYDGYGSSWDTWKTAEELRWEDGTPVIVGGPSDPGIDAAPDKLAAEKMAKEPPSQDIAASKPARSTLKLPVVGDNVKIKWGSSWWKGKIVEVDGERFRFSYDGYGSSSDEWKTAGQIRWGDDTPVIFGGSADPSSEPKPSAVVVAKSEPAQSNESSAAAESMKVAIDIPALEASTKTISSFPKGLTPQQTYDYIRQQITDGNPQVAWDWVPDEFRSYVVSQEQRDNLALLDEVNSRGLGVDHFLKELVIVLQDKREFVLKNPIVMLLLEDQANVNAFATVYGPATGLLDEFTQLIGNIDAEMRDKGFDAALRGRCDRIGKHLATLITAAPADQVQAFWNRIVVAEQGDGGTLTMVYPTGEKKAYPLVRINGRWIPRPLVEALLSYPEAQRKKVKEVKELSPARREGRSMGAEMARGVKDGNTMSVAEKLQAASKATSQKEFDAAIQQVLVALQVGGYLG